MHILLKIWELRSQKGPSNAMQYSQLGGGLGGAILEGGLLLHLAAAAQDAARQDGRGDAEDNCRPPPEEIRGNPTNRCATGFELLASCITIEVLGFIIITHSLAVLVHALLAHFLNEGWADVHGQEKGKQACDNAQGNSDHRNNLTLSLHHSAAQGERGQNNHNQTNKDADDGAHNQRAN